MDIITLGILGLVRAGVENYQITLGGDATEIDTIGQRAGQGFDASTIILAIERLVFTYLDLRFSNRETLLETFPEWAPHLSKQPFIRATAKAKPPFEILKHL